MKFVLEFEYLGIIASYKDFEFRSLQHRLSAADSNYGRLKRILHSTKYIGTRRRLIVYNACVRSSATYGLLAVGLTQAMLDKLCKFEIRHIRAIAKAPRHLYHEASTDLLNRLKQNTPVHFLLKIAKSKIGKIDLPNEFRSSLSLSIDTLERYVAGQGPQRAMCTNRFLVQPVDSSLSLFLPCVCTMPGSMVRHLGCRDMSMQNIAKSLKWLITR